MPRWCRYCGDVVYVGDHKLDGSLDVYAILGERSVPRPPLGVSSHRAVYIMSRQSYAVALGIHIGTRARADVVRSTRWSP